MTTHPHRPPRAGRPVTADKPATPPATPSGISAPSEPAGPLVELAETCRCGSSTSTKAPTMPDALAVITGWRENHACARPGDVDDRNRTGAGSAILSPSAGRRVGFGSAPEVEGPYRW